MKITATYTDSAGNSFPVLLSGQQDQLVIQAEVDPTFRVSWPLAQLRESTNQKGNLLLQWPPGTETVEIFNSQSGLRPAWFSQLPSRAHKSSPLRAMGWIALAVLFPYLLIELSALTVRFLPRNWEAKMFGGSHFFSTSEMCGIHNESKGRLALQKLIGRIYPLTPEDSAFSVDVNIVKRKEKNAFTFPGGNIYVLEKLLEDAKSPEELAGVLAHEIEHVKYRHGTRSAVRKFMLHGILGFFFSLMGTSPDFSLLDELMGLQFSREHEREADTGALLRLKRAEVSTLGFKDFFQRKAGEFRPPEFLSTHPSDSSRAENASLDPKQITRPVLTVTEWAQLKAICK